MITKGSWWASQNGVMAVTDLKSRFARPGTHGCYVEGENVQMLWLTEGEIRAAFKHFKPKRDSGRAPGWLKDPTGFRDVMWKDRWFCAGEIKYGWIRLTGLSQDIEVQLRRTKDDTLFDLSFDWGMQLYTTVFRPLSEVLPDLRPKYRQLSAIERIDTGLEPV